MEDATIDPMLRAIVHLAERGVSLTATFSVKGSIISGRLIGKNAYLREIRKQFNRQIHEENVPGLPEVLHLFNEVTDHTEIMYLHLDKGRVLDAAPPGNTVEGIWRIPLREIEGFSFGR